MATGRSYWHVPQGQGRQFVPGELAGYFNDLTAKTAWTGPVDRWGLPMVRVNGNLQLFPGTVLQKGLGHWDRWMQSRQRSAIQYEAFERAARWAVTAQDDRGGWPLPATEPASVSPYSAMSQGQGISVLCRAYLITGRDEYISAAVRAADLMLAPMASGGTACFVPEGIVLEENPARPPRTVLNGWIFALFGLYDLDLVLPRETLRAALYSTVKALAALLPAFDSGFWSYYDSDRTLASPFYHRLHIAELRALEMSFPDSSQVFAATADCFERYLGRFTNRLHAVVIKGCQKLWDPPTVIIE